jgi:predicted transcriptional regulator
MPLCVTGTIVSLTDNTRLSDREKELTEEDLASFIAASIPSIWALECLLLLKRLAPAAQTRTEIVTALRSSELAISQSLEHLEKAGLVSDSDGDYRYNPAMPLLGELAERVEQTHTRRPMWLMNVVLRAKYDKLQVFADSFRLKE